MLTTLCPIPPTGWRCTRVAGHEGPCASVPVTACKLPVPTWKCAVAGIILSFLLAGLGTWAVVYFNRPTPCPGEYFVTVQKPSWSEHTGYGFNAVWTVHDAHTVQERHCKE